MDLNNFDSGSEYHSKKTNTISEENTVFSYIRNMNSALKGVREGRENAPDSLMEECKGGHKKSSMHSFWQLVAD